MSAPFARRIPVERRPDPLAEPRLFSPTGVAGVLLTNAALAMEHARDADCRACAETAFAIIWAQAVKAERGEPPS